MLKRLFSWGLPGWFLFGWAVMNELSTAQTTAAVFATVFGFFNRYPAIEVAVGIVWLTLVATWPKWKPVWLQLPKTTHERLTVVETKHIPRIDSAHEALKQADIDLREYINVTFKQLLEHVNKSDGGLTKVLEAAEKATTSNAVAIVQVGTSVSALTLRTDEIDRRVGQIIPCAYLLAELLALVKEANACLDRFAFILNQYPQSIVAQKPLDKVWVTNGLEVMSEDIRLGIAWLEHLRRHALNAYFLKGHWGLELFTDRTITFYRYFSTQASYATVDGTTCFTLLKENEDNLRKVRDDYAASCLASEPRAAISPMDH